MRRLALPESWRERALVITDVADPTSWFAEQELAAAPKLARRRDEWMLARIAAKTLAGNRGLLVQRSRTLSLSHSHGFGAAAIDAHGVGIDIEVPRDISERAAHLFLADDGTAALQSATLPHRLIHFWAAKEAAWKRESNRYATLKQLPLRLIGTTPRGLRFDRVETFDAGELIVALTMNDVSR
jgi:hypothetical protein